MSDRAPVINDINFGGRQFSVQALLEPPIFSSYFFRLFLMILSPARFECKLYWRQIFSVYSVFYWRPSVFSKFGARLF